MESPKKKNESSNTYYACGFNFGTSVKKNSQEFNMTSPDSHTENFRTELRLRW